MTSKQASKAKAKKPAAGNPNKKRVLKDLAVAGTKVKGGALRRGEG